MNKLNKLTKEQMKNVMGGTGVDTDLGDGDGACPTVVANNCSSECPCSSERDWCVNGLCKSRQ